MNVPVRVEVGVLAVLVAIREEVRLPASLLLVVGFSLFDPFLAGGFKIEPHHFRRLPVDAARHLVRHWKEQIVRTEIWLRRQPRFEPPCDLRVKHLRVLAPSLAVTGRAVRRSRNVV
jgi:hypothetical protein